MSTSLTGSGITATGTGSNVIINNTGGGIQTTGTGVNINTAVYTDPVTGLASSGTAATNIGNNTGSVAIKGAASRIQAVDATGARVSDVYAGNNVAWVSTVDPTNNNVKSSFLAQGNDAKMYSEDSATGAIVSSVKAGLSGVDIVGSANTITAYDNTGNVAGSLVVTKGTGVPGIGSVSLTRWNGSGLTATDRTVNLTAQSNGSGTGDVNIGATGNVGITGTTNSIVGTTNINVNNTAATSIGNGTSTVYLSGLNNSSFANGVNANTSAAGASNVIITNTGGGIQTTGTDVNINTAAYNDPVTGLASSATANTNIGNATGTVGITGATTNINTTGGNTNIGNAGSTVTITGLQLAGNLNTTDIVNSGNVGTATLSTTGNATIGPAGTSVNLIQGATNTITGTTNVISGDKTSEINSTASPMAGRVLVNKLGSDIRGGENYIGVKGAKSKDSFNQMGNETSTNLIQGASNTINGNTVVNAGDNITHMGVGQDFNGQIGSGFINSNTGTAMGVLNDGSAGIENATNIGLHASQNIDVRSGGDTSLHALGNIETSSHGTSTLSTYDDNEKVVSSVETNRGGVSIQGKNNNIGTNPGSINTLGNAGTSTNVMQGANNNITATGANNITATTNNLVGNANNIGVANAGSRNTVGNAGTSTNVIQGANTTITGASATAPVYSNNAGTPTGTAGAISVYSTAQTNNSPTIGGKLDGVSYQNKISGNTYIDGNVSINGTLSYVSSSSATTTVQGGVAGVGLSTLSGDENKTASAQSGAVLKGARSGNQVDLRNGTIRAVNANAPATRNQNSLTVTNGDGNTHGVEVNEDNTVISGGRNSSAMTLNDNGATFSQVGTGAPVQVHGVADGTAPYDAVNVRQLSSVANRAYSGIAQIAAMTAVPGPVAGKNYSVGVGTGYYAGQTAMAFGAKANVTENIQVGASFSTGFSSASSTAASAGASFSW